jgi:hypothetical protein
VLFQLSGLGLFLVCLAPEAKAPNVQSIFRKKPAPAKAGVDTGFPSENAINAKMPERFLFSVIAKPH